MKRLSLHDLSKDGWISCPKCNSQSVELRNKSYESNTVKCLECGYRTKKSNVNMGGGR